MLCYEYSLSLSLTLTLSLSVSNLTMSTISNIHQPSHNSSTLLDTSIQMFRIQHFSNWSHICLLATASSSFLPSIESFRKILNIKVLKLMKTDTKDLNGHFSKNGIQMANRHEKMLSSTSHQGNANQNTMRSHPSQVRLAVIQKSANNAGEDMGTKVL